ncbi:hypothetical protein D3C76_1261050 [compost metagenome]
MGMNPDLAAHRLAGFLNRVRHHAVPLISMPDGGIEIEQPFQQLRFQSVHVAVEQQALEDGGRNQQRQKKQQIGIQYS